MATRRWWSRFFESRSRMEPAGFGRGGSIPNRRRMTVEPLEDRRLLSLGTGHDWAAELNAAGDWMNQELSDTDPPLAPVLTGVSDDTGVDGADGITADPTLLIHGTGEAGAVIEVFLAGASLGTTTADGSGAWTFDHTGTTLADGIHQWTATAEDAAGNVSPPSVPLSVTIDTAPPVQVQEIAKLLAAGGGQSDYFGYSVSISGGTAIVGAYRNDDIGGDAGSAYIFEDTGSGWIQVAELIAGDGAGGDYFGYSVSISGSTAIVGAYSDDDKGSNSGSAYIFEDTGSGWAQIAKLTAADGVTDDYFGYSVSISGDKAIVGAYGDDDNGSYSGSAYIFEDSGAGWTQVAKLNGTDTILYDYFGDSVSISGNLAIVGAKFDNDNGSSSGSAYIFEDTGSGWTQTAKLLAADGASSDYFGYSVSIDGSSAVVGAYGDDDKGAGSGSAYIFEDTGSGWTQIAKLTAGDGAAADSFGFSVSISGDKAIVGAWADDDDGNGSGAAYLFEDTDSGWTQVNKLTANDGAAADSFGCSVSINGTNAFVGAYGNGAAYVFGPGPLMAQLIDDTGASQEDLATADTTPELAFTFSEAVYGSESAVTVLDPNTNALIPDSITGWGSDTLTVSFGTPLTVDGEYTVTLNGAGTINDAAGNRWSDGTSEAVAFTLDTVAPVAPSALDLQAGSDTGLSDADDITSDTTPTFDVSTTPYFRVYRDNVLISGPYEAGNSFTPSVQPGGTYAFTVRAVDAVGNESAPSPALTVTIDTVAPGVPPALDLQAGSDTGMSGTDDITSDTTPTFDVTATPYFRVYRDGVQISGNYEVGSSYVPVIQNDGTFAYTVRAVDAAGNLSSQSVPLTVTIDTAAPIQNMGFDLAAKLLAGDGTSYDEFGYSVSIDGITAIIGMPSDDDNGSNSGSAYIFEDTGSGWSQVAKLTAGDGASYDYFGYSVSISGSAAIIGAYGDDDGGSYSGSAYIFEDTGSGWSQVAKLNAADGAGSDRFGRSVSIDRGTAIVGAYWDDDNGSDSGSAYIFEDTGSGWTQVAKLNAADGESSDYFGLSVAISGTTAIIGAEGDDDCGYAAGSAYVFGDTGSGWTQLAKLAAADTAAGDTFGCSVAIDGSSAIVGAKNDSDSGISSGSAYIFTDTGSGWTEIAKLNAGDGAASDAFGWAVGVSGGMAVVGALGDDGDGADYGSAYIFEDSGSGWTQVAKLIAADGAAGDKFGAAVSISGDKVVVGAAGDDDNGLQAGSAYMLVHVPPLSEDTGTSHKDRVTRDTTPEVRITFSEVVYGQDSDVTVLDPYSSPVIPDSIAGWGSNALTIRFSTPLTVDGEYTITLNGTSTITDAAGNALNNGIDATLGFTLDTTAPATPAAPDLQPASDLGASDSDNITSDTTPTFEVSASPYFRVYRDGIQISDDCETGSSYTPTVQGSGTYDYTLRAVDEAGNESAESEALRVTIDTEPVVVLAAQLSDDTGISTEDRITNDVTPEVAITFSEVIYGQDIDVTVLDPNSNSETPGSITGWGSDTLTVSFSTPLTADGEYTVTLNGTGTIRDAAGNALNNGVNEIVAFTIDSAAPSAPSTPDLQAGSDTGASNVDNVTSYTTPSFELAGLPYYRLYRDGIQISGDYQFGSYTDVALADGMYAYTVRAVDVAGNESAPSAVLNVTVDTIAPAAPGAPDLQAGSDTGVSDTDDITNDTTPTFDAIGSPYFRLYRDGVQISGDFESGSCTVAPQADGTYDYMVVAVDTAGNVSAQGGALSVTFDTDPPIQIQQIAKILASDSAADDWFGHSVSISGTTAIIGAYGDDDNSAGSGSAYIFQDTGTGWTQVAKLTAADGVSGDSFGYSVSISGNTAIVGALRDDDNGETSGSAYIFKDTGSGWTQVAKLIASDGAEYDWFGNSVSVSGATAIVGAYEDDDNGDRSGSAYIFQDSGSGWTQVTKLTADNGAAYDCFGNSVSISGTTAIVGAYKHDGNGSAYVFTDSGSGWTQVGMLTAGDGEDGDYFGDSVSISGRTAIVGASRNDGTAPLSGAAYVFEDTGSGWVQVAKLTASDGGTSSRFGCSVSIDDGKALVGAYGDGSFSGSAYIFQDTRSGWREVAKLVAEDAARWDHFGYSVSISGVSAIAGAYRSEDSGPATGSAYVFGPAEHLTAQLTDDTGASPDDRITNDTTPELTFSFSEAVYGQNSNVAVLDPNTNPVTPDSIAGWGSDTLTITFSTPLTVEGEYTLTLNAAGTITDVAGNALNGGVDEAVVFTIDVLASPAPTALDLQTGSDTGVSGADNITSDTTPTFNVSATPYFRVYRDGIQISGDFENGSSYTPPVQADGTYGYTVRAVDAAGNESAPSAALSVTINTGVPAAPDALDLQYGSDTGVNDSDNITSDATPTFDLSATPYFRVYRDGIRISGDYETGGTYTPAAQADGTYEYTVTAVDAAGNESAPSIALTVTIDTAAPVQYDRFEQISKLLAGATEDWLGYSVAVDAGRAIVGAYENGGRPGSAYIFEETDSGWIQVAKLTADDSEYYHFFGESVSISGSTAIVGAHGDDTYGISSGAAYIFERIGSGWTQVAKLIASDAAQDDQFGNSVSISGNTAIVGAHWGTVNGVETGSAYIFENTGSGWTQVAKLAADDADRLDEFGRSVSIDGSRAIVGAPVDFPGSAYVFEDSGSGWTQVAKLTAAGFGGSDRFGHSVSIHGNTVIVGAWRDDPDGVTDSGSAYIFQDTGSGWTQVVKLTDPDGADSDYFGYSVSIDAGMAAVGAYFDDDNGANSGSTFIYENTGSNWIQVAKVTTADGAADDRLGCSVAISGDRLLVGAWGDDDNGSNSGSAYVYSLTNILDLEAASDTGDSDTDNITGDNTPTFHSSAEPSFRLYRDGIQISGDYESGSYTETALADGTYDYTVVTVDAAGNVSAQSAALRVTIDTSLPAATPVAPDLQAASDTGVSDTDNITNDATPTFDIDATPYFRVYRDGVQISGDYESGSSYTAPVQADGTYAYTVRAVNVIGNESAPSTALMVTIDTGAAAAPAAPDLHASSDTGFSDSDNITSDTTPTFNVSAAPYFRLYRDGIPISGDYESGGTFTPAPQAGGPSNYTLTSVDVAGNESPPSVALRVTIDDAHPIQIEQIARLLADGGMEDDRFGHAVSIDGNTAIVGAYNNGAAYIFENTGSGWAQVAKLTASDGATFDYFGRSVSISGARAIIGSSHDDDRGFNSGSAYIFEDTGSGWTQVAKLTAADGAPSDYFGGSVSISGDRAVVGANGDADNGYYTGSAYVFEDSGSGWVQVAKLTADDGAAYDYFGDSVSISGATTVIGARGDDDNGSYSGSAYIFEDAGFGWSQVAKLTAADGTASDNFGRSVSISGSTAIIGADGDADNGSSSGSAYVFENSGSGWAQIAKLIATDIAAGDQFGGSVSISGNTAIVGAFGDDDSGTASGSAYLFENSVLGWTQVAKLTANDGVAMDFFGHSVAISGGTAIVAADGDDTNGSNSGSAYIMSKAEQLAGQLADDTGVSSDDGITNDTTPQLTFSFGEAVYGQNSDLTVLDPNFNLVTPDSISGWGSNTLTIGFSTPLTVDGEYTVTLNGTSTITDAAGNVFNNGAIATATFMIDSVSPDVTMIMDLNAAGGATMNVTATDTLSGVPDGTVVWLDVDLNNDLDYLDPGEAAYMVSSLTAGTATFDVSPALPAGVYNLRARVIDVAGNQGTSARSSLVRLESTTGDDTIVVQPGVAGTSLHRVTINGALTTYDPAVYEAFSIDGLGGNDMITIVGTTGAETATLSANSVNMLGPAYQVQATSVETIYVYGGAGDTASLTGNAAGSNTFKGRPTYSELEGPTSYHYVSGFDAVTASPGGGSNNRALLYGSAGADVLTASASAATIDWDGVPIATATGFNEVLAFGGAGDTASLTGNGAGGNTLYGRPAYSELKSAAFYLYAGGFDTVTATPGGGNNNRALLYGGTGADIFTATPTSAIMDLAGAPSITATGFNMVLGFGGSGDTANLTGDSAGDNFLQSRLAYTNMSGASYYYLASGFQTVTAASGGGTNNRAFFYNDAAASSLTADPTNAAMDWNGTSTATVSDFDRVFAFGSAGDTATFTGNSAGNNTFEGRPDFNALTGAGYYHYANGFDSVGATAGGGTNNRAFLYGGAGADTLSAGPTTGTMTWSSGRVALMSGFDKVFGYGSIGDTANLTGDATATNTFDGYSSYSTLYSAAFYHYASGFDLVTATAGSATNDRANLYDSVLNDLFTFSPGSGQMDYGDDASTDISVLAFERIHTRFLNGGNDDADLTDSAAVDQFTGTGPNGQLTDAAAYWLYLYFDSLGTDTVTLNSTDTGNTVDATSLDYVLNYDPAYWTEI